MSDVVSRDLRLSVKGEELENFRALIANFMKPFGGFAR